ncbi:MAG: M48 family metalloprotease, partial [Clostridia bacterium]|nr:M48 family metalloprotease [Clostridia bacterium]
LLYETVRKAAEKSRCRKKISVCAYGEGVSVSSYKNSAIICINYIHAAVFTRDELYNVMLHEFAHVNNADVKRAIKFSRAEQRLDSSANGNFIIDFGKLILLPLPSVAVIFKTNAYNVFASLYHEMKADKALKELGDPQKSVDALAKSKMISIYSSLPYRELDYDFYAPEQPGGDYAAQNVALYLKQRDIQGAKWRELIDKELPARVASHPAFCNRMAALGCQSYDAYREETDPDYIAEQRDIIKFADEVMTTEYSGNYQNMREDYYLKRKKEIDEYAAAVKNGEPVPDSALFTYLQAHFGVDDDTAIEIADKMIAVLPDPSYANYYKGMILFNRIDDGCVEYFKAVAASTDDYELAMNAVSFIGEYALKTGNKELLNEYRSTAPETVQISRDKGERNKLKNDSVLEKCDLGESVLRQIIDGID